MSGGGDGEAVFRQMAPENLEEEDFDSMSDTSSFEDAMEDMAAAAGLLELDKDQQQSKEHELNKKKVASDEQQSNSSIPRTLGGENKFGSPGPDYGAYQDGDSRARPEADCDKDIDKALHGEEDEPNPSDEDEPQSKLQGEDIESIEETLKDRDKDLSEEEKEMLKKEALQLKAEGNILFGEQKFEEASIAYTNALQQCPLCFTKERSIMYSNRGACKMKLEKTTQAIEDCSKAIELDPNYLKCLMRRAELYEQTEKLEEALADHQKVLELDPSQYKARAACMRLPDQIKEKNEKLKEEMMGKLKDLGNMVLRPFGLSTNNFKLNQDPETGGYSVQFQQNPGPS